MPDPNDALRKAISKMKSASADSPMHFVFIKGRTDSALLIEQGRPSPRLIADAKKECSGSSLASGTCFGENGVLVFETAGDPPGSLAGGLKNCIRQSAGMAANVETRKAGTTDESEASESESGEEAPAPAPPSQQGPSPQELAAHRQKIVLRVKALQTRLGASSARPPHTIQAFKAKMAQVAARFQKSDFDHADKLLDEAEELL